MRKVTLFLGAPPQSWVKSLLGMGELNVKILDCLPSEEGGHMNEFFEITCPDVLMPDVIRRLQQAKEIKDLEITLKPSHGRIFGSLRTVRCDLCKCFTTSGCFLGSAVYDMERDGVRWSFYVKEGLVLQIIKALEKQGIQCTIEENSSIHSFDELTGRQERLLELALKKGFFDSPRKIGTRDLAKDFNVAPPSVSVSLRRALKKVVRTYLKTGKR